MRARRTEFTDRVINKPGGTDDDILWAYFLPGDSPQNIAICSVWVPTDDERERIAAGENIRLGVHSSAHPPVTMDLTDEKVLGVDRE